MISQASARRLSAMSLPPDAAELVRCLDHLDAAFTAIRELHPEPPHLQPRSPFEGTAPVGTLTDAVSVYRVAGDPSRALRVDMTTSRPREPHPNAVILSDLVRRVVVLESELASVHQQIAALHHQADPGRFTCGASTGPLQNQCGHQFGQPYDAGYAVCGWCGAREDSQAAAQPCRGEAGP